MLARTLTSKGALTSFENPKLPAGLCFPVIVVEPPFRIVSVNPETVAMAGSDTANVQDPEELEVGGTIVNVLPEVEPNV
jgi:hypothetical protein